MLLGDLSKLWGITIDLACVAAQDIDRLRLGTCDIGLRSDRMDGTITLLKAPLSSLIGTYSLDAPPGNGSHELRRKNGRELPMILKRSWDTVTRQAIAEPHFLRALTGVPSEISGSLYCKSNGSHGSLTCELPVEKISVAFVYSKHVSGDLTIIATQYP
jgi:hypothetical protein